MSIISIKELTLSFKKKELLMNTVKIEKKVTNLFFRAFELKRKIEKLEETNDHRIKKKCDFLLSCLESFYVVRNEYDFFNIRVIELKEKRIKIEDTTLYPRVKVFEEEVFEDKFRKKILKMVYRTKKSAIKKVEKRLNKIIKEKDSSLYDRVKGVYYV